MPSVRPARHEAKRARWTAMGRVRLMARLFSDDVQHAALPPAPPALDDGICFRLSLHSNGTLYMSVCGLPSLLLLPVLAPLSLTPCASTPAITSRRSARCLGRNAAMLDTRKASCAVGTRQPLFTRGERSGMQKRNALSPMASWKTALAMWHARSRYERATQRCKSALQPPTRPSCCCNTSIPARTTLTSDATRSQRWQIRCVLIRKREWQLQVACLAVACLSRSACIQCMTDRKLHVNCSDGACAAAPQGQPPLQLHSCHALWRASKAMCLRAAG